MDEMSEVFESVARYFSLLSEPTRLRIMHVICQEAKSVNQIVEETGFTQTNVSRHLGVMYQGACCRAAAKGPRFSIACRMRRSPTCAARCACAWPPNSKATRT